MLEPKVRGVIAQREKKMIMRVMRRAEKRDSFRDNSLERRYQLGTDRQVRVVARGNVNLVRRIRCERNHDKIFAREHWRIDQPVQRYQREVDLSWLSGPTGTRQPGRDFPTCRKRHV